MKRLIGTLFVFLFAVSFGVAQQPPKKAAKGSGAAESLKQIERDWTDAEKSGDADKIASLMAENWTGIGPDGARVDKQQYVSAFKGGDNKYESIDVGDMDVYVSGNIGVVQGSDTEKSSSKGKDSSGKYSWMDVFEKKNGKWLAVRSEVTKGS